MKRTVLCVNVPSVCLFLACNSELPVLVNCNLEHECVTETLQVPVLYHMSLFEGLNLEWLIADCLQ